MTAEPMTTEELAAIRGAIERTDLFDEETLPLAFSDRKRLLAEVDRLRAENARLAAQDRVSGPETPQGHPSEGTGVPGPEKPAQAVERGRQIAVSMMDRAEAAYRHEHGQPHTREHCESCAEEYWRTRLAPAHYREAAASLRALGHDTAAELLDSTARDLEEGDTNG